MTASTALSAPARPHVCADATSATVRTEVRRDQTQRRDVVVEAFRVARGIRRPETARQRLMRLSGEMVDAIHAFQAHADPRRYQEFVAPVQAALVQIDQVKLTDELELRAQDADTKEEVAEKAFDKNECPATAAARVRAIDVEVALESQVRAGLVAKFGLRA